MKRQAKAIVAGLIAGAAYAIPVVDDGLAPSEGLGIFLALLAGWQGVYWTTNRTTTTTPGQGAL